MGVDIILILLGLAALLIAGDLLVRGAVGVATALKIPTLLVSLTIVAFGTSAPEMVVSIRAILAGEPGIALGNIVGSNIANVLIVLGLPALIFPISSRIKGLPPHAGAMLAATALFAVFAYLSGGLGRTAGAVLLAGIFLYVGVLWARAQRAGSEEPVLHDAAEYAETSSLSARTLLFLVAGLAGLPFGAGLIVENAAELAADAGIREAIIGLTIVAIGTSLPELATVAAAALHKKSDVAIGGVIGSNIFNLLAVGGVAGLVGGAAFDPIALRLEIPVMVAASLLLAYFVLARRDIGRVAGFTMIAAYAAFIVALIATAAP